MITLEVSRWIRSCSIPIRITQAGESQAIGSDSGMSSDEVVDKLPQPEPVVADRLRRAATRSGPC